ncbi:hypothetical protein PLESTB_000583800 [Pleodorina starrii]|uniref:Cytochrome P450 n=1 Tax=Pleodorina starrii TaxID=330485 RepID=A0A9W6F1A2_9CHLO|nr:hypothetical protein PLESTM_000300600 [Pleodorina starrii]GLC52110.1 hypothetical protein PLESTB_000583800 [Pleodorina starrii]GLC72257.1 hypothetical protein PLESTF_001224400 [Pleodorina starrii]
MVALLLEFVRTPLAALALLLGAAVGFLCWLGFYPLRRWRYRHFPGPIGLPFVGNLPEITAMDTTPYLAHVSRKYGAVCKVWFGTRPWLVISDPDLVRKLACQSTARAIELASYLDVLVGENREIELASAFFAHGEPWRRGRRVFEMAIIHPASLSAHLPVIRRVLGRFVPSLARYTAASATSGQPPLDAQKAVGDLMLAITGELAYGVDFEVDFEDAAAEPRTNECHAGAGAAATSGGGIGAHLARVSREVFETFRMDNATVYLPIQMAFPSLAPAIRWMAAHLPDKNQRRVMACRSTMAAISRQLMAQWAEAKHRGHGGAEAVPADAVKVQATCHATNGKVAAAVSRAGSDGALPLGIHAFREIGSGISASSFMAAMLEERKGAGAQDRLSDIEVIAQSITFILASYETSSTTTSLALLLLATHPEAQRALTAEVDAMGGREIDMELLAELHYTEAVIKETMRLYPAVPMMHRHAKGDIQLPDGRVVPRQVLGTFLAIPNYNVHHDPALWPEPERFMPERFLTGPGGGGGPTHPAAWSGFGLGARMCVGHKLASMIGKATLLSLFRRYTFSVAPHQPVPPPMATGLTFGPKGGVWLNVHAR